MWEGYCATPGTNMKQFAGNWTVDKCLALSKSTTLPWVTGFFFAPDGKWCVLSGDCEKSSGGDWVYYQISTENTPATIG